MLTIPSDVEGKQVFYGDIRESFEKEGFYINGSWEYYSAYFDSILYQDGGETIYLRLPATVVQGKLERDDARLEFGRPFLIKHIANTGLSRDDFDFSALDMLGLSQFQKPLDPDDKIEQETRWRKAGETVLNRIKKYMH